MREPSLSAKFDPASEVERAKYVRAYTQSQRYREKSGKHIFMDEQAVRKYVATLQNKDLAIDFGCGNGSSALLLNELGFEQIDLIDFVGLDHAPEEVLKLRDEGKAAFYRWSLWERNMQTLDPANFTVCTDVMEHIPEDKVDAVMGTIRAKTDPFDGVSYWRIALWGSETPEQKAKAKANYGGELHVTVRPAVWWVEKLKKLYEEVDYEVWANPRKPNRRVLIAFCRPHSQKTPR